MALAVLLNKLTKWLGGLVEKKGVNIFTQFAGKELLYEGAGAKEDQVGE